MKDRRVIYLGAACAAYLALWLATPKIGALKHQVALFVLTALFMYVQLSITRWFASLMMRPLWAVCVMIGAGLAWVGVVLAVAAPYIRYDAKELGPVPVRMRRAAPPASIELTIPQRVRDGRPGAAPVKFVKVKAVRRPADLNFKIFAFGMAAGRARAVTSLLIIVAASALGYLVSFVLRHPNIVLPVAAFSAYVDIWTVLVGPTSRAIEKIPHVVHAVSAALPAPGSATAEPISFVGPADFIFLAMFFGALYRLGMEPRRTFWIAFPLLSLGMTAVLAGQFAPGLPALVLIGFAVIMANFRHFKLKREEYIAMGIVAVLLVAAIFVLTPVLSRGR